MVLMDSPWVNKPADMIIQDILPFWPRTLGAAAAVFLLVWVGTGFFLNEGNYALLSFALVFAGSAFYFSFIKSDVRWTIRT
jgi:hypothetical protein